MLFILGIFSNVKISIGIKFATKPIFLIVKEPSLVNASISVE